MSRIPRAGVFAALGLALALAGCSGESDECKRPHEQPFFVTVTDGLPTSQDPSADIVLDTDAVFLGLTRYPAETPPVDEVRFRYGDTNLLFIMSEGVFPLPVEVDSTYHLTLELTQRLVPAAYGLRISDAEGVRFLAVTDWRPLSRIFEDGYGDLAPDEELRVYLSDSGCDPVEENSTCFLERRKSSGRGTPASWRGSRSGPTRP